MPYELTGLALFVGLVLLAVDTIVYREMRRAGRMHAQVRPQAAYLGYSFASLLSIAFSVLTFVVPDGVVLARSLDGTVWALKPTLFVVLIVVLLSALAVTLLRNLPLQGRLDQENA